MTGAELGILAGAAAILTVSNPRGRETVARGADRVNDWRRGRRQAPRSARLPRDADTSRGGLPGMAQRMWKKGTRTIGPVSVDTTPTVRLAPAAVAPTPRIPVARSGGTTRPRAPRVVLSEITRIIDDLGETMTAFRTINRAIDKAGEIEPATLHGLLDVLTGVMGTHVAVTNLVGEIADYADDAMWVDLEALGPLFELETHAQANAALIQKSMSLIRKLYPEQLKAEEAAAEDGPRPHSGGPRTLNPQVVTVR